MAEKSAASVEKSSTASAAEPREEVASRLVDRFAVWSGVAGLIPMPFVDAFAVGGVQVQMLRRLSQIYGVPFSENRGKALIAAFAGAALPSTSTIGLYSTVKAVPLLGSIVGGLAMPMLSAGATYAIGQAFIKHFESGGTLLDFNPPDYHQLISSQKEIWDAGVRRFTRASGTRATGAGPSGA